MGGLQPRARGIDPCGSGQSLEIQFRRKTEYHLGILRTVSPSSFARTSERCSAGRSAFFSLNVLARDFAVCTRYHPAPIQDFLPSYLHYGCELRCINQTELLMPERVYRKILRTITDLTMRCNTKALLHTLGTFSIRGMLHQRQLNFLHSFLQIFFLVNYSSPYLVILPLVASFLDSSLYSLSTTTPYQTCHFRPVEQWWMEGGCY